jgi:hypothetical protein
MMRARQSLNEFQLKIVYELRLQDAQDVQYNINGLQSSKDPRSEAAHDCMADNDCNVYTTIWI